MYCGARITPCESCPRRLAPTRLSDTTRASSPGTPASANREVTNSVSSDARNDGIAGSPGCGQARDFDLTPPTDICNPGPAAFELAGRDSPIEASPRVRV